MNDDLMEEMFKDAYEDELWFYCSYQALWFSPDELKAAQQEGMFKWGAQNFTLRDPGEHIIELEKSVANVQKTLADFKERVQS